MAGTNGYGKGGVMQKYEDVTSLKKNLNSSSAYLTRYEFMTHCIQTSTGSDVELVSLENGAVADIGKTEQTWVFCTAVADDTTADGKVITLVYKSNDGVEHTTHGTFAAADTTTETAFSPAVADGYCVISCSISGAVTTRNVTVGVTGMAAPVATISNTATSATAAQILGVGAVYGRSHTDHGDASSSVYGLTYMTPWGEVKTGATLTLGVNGEATTPATDGQRFLEADGSTYVSDFYRVIAFSTSKTTTANGHEGLLVDAACSNVNGGGGDVYACINELCNSAVVSGFTAPEDGVADMFLGNVKAQAVMDAVGDYYILKIKHTPYGGAQQYLTFDFDNQPIDIDLCIRLEPDSTIDFYIADSNGAGEVMVTATYYIGVYR